MTTPLGSLQFYSGRPNLYIGHSVTNSDVGVDDPRPTFRERWLLQLHRLPGGVQPRDLQNSDNSTLSSPALREE